MTIHSFKQFLTEASKVQDIVDVAKSTDRNKVKTIHDMVKTEGVKFAGQKLDYSESKGLTSDALAAKAVGTSVEVVLPLQLVRSHEQINVDAKVKITKAGDVAFGYYNTGENKMSFLMNAFVSGSVSDETIKTEFKKETGKTFNAKTASHVALLDHARAILTGEEPMFFLITFNSKGKVDQISPAERSDIAASKRTQFHQ